MRILAVDHKTNPTWENYDGDDELIFQNIDILSEDFWRGYFQKFDSVSLFLPDMDFISRLQKSKFDWLSAVKKSMKGRGDFIIRLPASEHEANRLLTNGLHNQNTIFQDRHNTLLGLISGDSNNGLEIQSLRRLSREEIEQHFFVFDDKKLTTAMEFVFRIR